MSTQDDPDFGRLKRLLAAKRHERPPQSYFDGFLDEFHRRQRAEPIRKRGWWDQLRELFRAEPLLAARYALGAAAVLVLGVNIFLLAHRPAPTPFTPMPPPVAFATEQRPVQVASNAQVNSGPHYILDRVDAAPVTYEPQGDF